MIRKQSDDAFIMPAGGQTECARDQISGKQMMRYGYAADITRRSGKWWLLRERAFEDRGIAKKGRECHRGLDSGRNRDTSLGEPENHEEGTAHGFGNLVLPV